MVVKKGLAIKSSEITPKKLYMNRRKFIASSAAVAGLGLIKPIKGEYTVAEKLTSYEEATGYLRGNSLIMKGRNHRKR